VRHRHLRQVANYIDVSEADGIVHTNQPVMIGRWFNPGDFPSGTCPQPVTVAATGVVNVSGTNVTWVSGAQFTTGGAWNGLAIGLNGSTAFSTISSVTDTTHLLLTSSAGTLSSVTYLAGTPLTSYGADLKKAWSDGSAQFGIFNFPVSLAAATSSVNQTARLTWQRTNSACVNTGFLTQAQMLAFNSAVWDTCIAVTPAGGTQYQACARAMLSASDPGANTFGDCKNNYWLQSTYATSVVLQDCTSATAFDFGWPFVGPLTAVTVDPSFNGAGGASSGTCTTPTTTVNDPAGGTGATVTLNVVNGVVASATVTNGGTGYSNPTFTITNTGCAGSIRLTPTVNATMGALVQGTITSKAVFHPMFQLVYYPATNLIWVDAILELPWLNKGTDQKTDALDVTANGATIAHYGADTWQPGQRYHWTYWLKADNTGSEYGPGFLSIDHNFPALVDAYAWINFDMVSTAHRADPTRYSATAGQDLTSWDKFRQGDRGKRGGNGGLQSMPYAYANNSEGAPIQREDWLWLMNGQSSIAGDSKGCAFPNSYCRMAFQILSGKSGILDTNIHGTDAAHGDCPGGCGAWSNLGNVNFHFRQDKTVATGRQTVSNYYFVPKFAGKDALANDTCNSGATCITGTQPSFITSTAVNSGTGRSPSRYTTSGTSGTASTVGFKPNTFIGAVSTVPWNETVGCDHWLNYHWTPYETQGTYYYLEENYFGASHCLQNQNLSSYGIFGYNYSDNSIRSLGWTFEAVLSAAKAAPDASPEFKYFDSMIHSMIETMEGTRGITGTTHTPSSTNPDCSNYSQTNPNRWNYAHCQLISKCPTGTTCQALTPGLHNIAAGGCNSTGSSGPSYMSNTTTSGTIQFWQSAYTGIEINYARELGYDAAKLGDEFIASAQERVLDSAANAPFLLASTYLEPLRAGNANATCPSNSEWVDPFVSTFAQMKSLYLVGLQSQSTYNSDGNKCTNHWYPITARALATFGLEFGTYTLLPGCPGGVCSALPAWDWYNKHVPFFNNPIPDGSSVNCGTSDTEGKFSAAPRLKAARAKTLYTSINSFASQATGTTSAAQSIQLTNVGGLTLNITSVATTGDFGYTKTCGTTLTTNCNINVTFTPAAVGTRTGTLTVVSDAPTSPDVISLSGTGVSGSPTTAIASSSKYAISKGESITLSYDTVNATACDIATVIGGVQIADSSVPCGLNQTIPITPTLTATYVLTGIGPGGVSSSSVKILVSEATTSQQPVSPR
jgi:hypothetical protein